MRRTTGATFLSCAVILLLFAPSRRARSSDWCGEECVNIDIDASLGLEALQEPKSETDEATLEEGASETIGYGNVFASGLVQLYQFQAIVAAPLRFDLSDFGIRTEDWDEPGDYFRIVPCARVDFMDIESPTTGIWSPVRWDERGACRSWTPTEAVGDVFRDPWEFTYWSVRMAPLNSFTLGTGSIVDNYNATIEENFYREGVEVEINLNRRFVFLAGLSDIIEPTVLAGRAVFRPVDSETEGYYAGDPRTQLFWELGVTAASDLSAPTLLNIGGELKQEAILIGGLNTRFRWSSVNDYSRDTYRIIRFELGGQFNQMFDRDFGTHANLRFYYDVGTIDFYIDGEWRMLKGRYIPNYFDTHYRVQRSQYPLSEAQREGFSRSETLFTKLDFLNNLPDDTEQAYASSFRMRFWPWDEEQSAWTRDGADFWIFIEDVPTRTASGRAGTGLEFPNIADRLRLWGEFVQQGWDTFGQIFTVQNSVLNVESRIILTEAIYLDLYYRQTWFLFEDGLFDSTNDVGFDVGFVQENL